MNKKDLRKAKKNGEMTDAIVNKAKQNGYAGGYTGKQFGDLFFYKPLGAAHGYCLPIGNFLFDHDFAKAFWGEGSVCGGCGNIWEDWVLECWCDKNDIGEKAAWQYHLQQAVLSEDPLLYYFERL